MAKLKDLKVTIGLSKKGLTKLNSDLRRTKANFRRNFGEIQGMVRGVGRGMTTALTVPLAGIGAAAVKSAAQLETLETSFISLTGGAKQAADMMQNLNRFTAKTPFQIENVANAARQLIASGTEVGQVNDQLQFLGDIAATSGVSIEEIAAIFAKVNAKGKVELESLNQLAERGIPIFDALAEATGLPADKLGAGAVSVEQFNQVLSGFAQEGGFAAGAMERLSGTAAGKFSTAMDNLKLAGAELVKGLMPTISKILDGVTAMAQRFTALSDTTKNTILGIAAVLGAAGPIAMAVAALMPVFAALTGPIGLVVLAIGGIVTAVLAFRKEISGPLADAANFFIDIYNEVAPIRVAIAILTTAVQANFKIIRTAGLAVFDAFKSIGMALYELLVSGDLSAAKDVLTKGFQDIGDDIFDAAVSIGEDFATGISDGMRNRIERVDASDISSALDFGSLLGGGGAAAGGGVTRMEEMTRRTSAAVTSANATIIGSYTEVAKAVKLPVDQMMVMGEYAAGQLPGFFEGAFSAIKDGTKSFGEFMMQTLERLLIKAASLAATFAVISLMFPGSAVASGGFGAFMKGGMGIPQMADGGLFTGASLAMVGEGPGTSAINPEVVAPLDKLQQMMGGGNVTVTGMIRGNDILLSNERSLLDRNRVRGF
jgi:tape measure domain-containing protein